MKLKWHSSEIKPPGKYRRTNRKGWHFSVLGVVRTKSRWEIFEAQIPFVSLRWMSTPSRTASSGEDRMCWLIPRSFPRVSTEASTQELVDKYLSVFLVTSRHRKKWRKWPRSANLDGKPGGCRLVSLLLLLGLFFLPFTRKAHNSRSHSGIREESIQINIQVSFDP